MMNENSILLTLLGLIDISIVINLLFFFIDRYNTFESKNEFENHTNQGEWLAKKDTGCEK